MAVDGATSVASAGAAQASAAAEGVAAGLLRRAAWQSLSCTLQLMEAVMRDDALRAAVQNEEHVPQLVEALCGLATLKVSQPCSLSSW
jgi:hypothetical protein